LKSGHLTQGESVEIFEDSVAKYVGAKFAVAVSSGTAGLHLACLAAGVGNGDSVITSPITFVASANCATYLGAKVIFADIDPLTLKICPEKINECLKTNKKIKALIPVHFAGLACDMSSIANLAQKSGIVVIEDAAHAFGACYSGGKKVGSCEYSAMTVFSFHPVKSIAAGEGGLITTNDESLYRRLIRLRSHGINKAQDNFLDQEASQTNGNTNLWYYEMQELGYNYRIPDILCALANSQLKRLDDFIEKRKQLAQRYDNFFREFDLAKPAQVVEGQSSAHHIYPLRIDFSKIGISRTELMKSLLNVGIGSQVHYIPVPHHPYYKLRAEMPAGIAFAEDYYSSALTIPLYYDLTFLQQEAVVSGLKELIS
jgi:UDP-4-amino-4,6-dideoxy-N-acetyl-beta-L-altrosamine transaminase